MSRAKSSLPVKPTLIIDTREKKPLFEENPNGDKDIKAYIREKVDAGDYTIREIPDLVVVEKKKRR